LSGGAAQPDAGGFRSGVPRGRALRPLRGVCRVRVLLLIFIFALSTCRSATPAAATGRIRVAVSVPPQAYFVERIGGRHVDVTVMLAPGQPDEEVAVSPRRLAALTRARLYVRVGHPAFVFERRAVDPYLAQLPGLTVVDMVNGHPPGAA